MPQVLECLPRKHKVLSLNLSTTKIKTNFLTESEFGALGTWHNSITFGNNLQYSIECSLCVFPILFHEGNFRDF